jgi:PPOX class probable F420-dependent enzyme
VSDLAPDLKAELLEGPYPCCLTTLGKDGAPYSVVLWCGRDGERVTVNATEGRWLRNLRRDPRVSLVVVHTDNILRYLAIQGTVGEVELDEEYEHINALSQVYEGEDYPWSKPEEVPRFRITIEPTSTRVVDLA